MFSLKKNLCAILTLVCCLAFMAVAGAAERADDRLISVDGQGTAAAMPDMAVVSLSITNFAKDAAEAQGTNADTTTAVLKALKELGIAEGELETRNYSFNPSYDADEHNKIAGYQVNNTLLVTVKEVNKAGAVIDTALANGANNINYLHFSLQQPEKIRKAALKNAIADARLKAEIIAEELGVKIVGIKLVTENVSSLFARDAMPMLAAQNKGSHAATPVAVKEIELSAGVHIEYIIA